MEEYFEIGQIVNTSGLKGEIKVKPFTDNITEFESLKTIYVSIADNLKKFVVQKVRYSKNMVFIKLEGIDTLEEAKKYRNLYLKIHRKNVVQPKANSYFISDIIGCKVFTDKQEELGKIGDVFPTGSNDVYVIKDETGKEILLPAIKQVIKKVDVENKVIIVHLMEGLI